MQEITTNNTARQRIRLPGSMFLPKDLDPGFIIEKYSFYTL
jgi:hypothetical protein